MKYFVTLKSATCHHPCLPIHPSVYIHEHHYVYPYTHQQYPRTSLRPLLEKAQAGKSQRSQPKILSNNMCVWAIPAFGKSSLDRLTWSLFLTLLLRIFEDTPWSSSRRAWQQLFHPSFYNLWEHQGKLLTVEARMIGNTLSAGWKENCTKNSERFFLCFTLEAPTITDPQIKLLRLVKLSRLFPRKTTTSDFSYLFFAKSSVY